MRYVLLLLMIAFAACDSKDKKAETPAEVPTPVAVVKPVKVESYMMSFLPTCGDEVENDFQIMQIGLPENADYPIINRCFASLLSSTFISITMPQDATASQLFETFNTAILPDYCKRRKPSLRNISVDHFWTNNKLVSAVHTLKFMDNQLVTTKKCQLFDVNKDEEIEMLEVFSEDKVAAFVALANLKLVQQLRAGYVKIQNTSQAAEYKRVLLDNIKQLTVEGLEQEGVQISKVNRKMYLELIIDFDISYRSRSIEPNVELKWPLNEVKLYLSDRMLELL